MIVGTGETYAHLCGFLCLLRLPFLLRSAIRGCEVFKVAQALGRSCAGFRLGRFSKLQQRMVFALGMFVRVFKGLLVARTQCDGCASAATQRGRASVDDFPRVK
jgi:hypothetical protein